MAGRWRMLYAWVESLVHKHDFKRPGMNQTMCEEQNVNAMPMQLTIAVRGEGIQ